MYQSLTIYLHHIYWTEMVNFSLGLVKGPLQLLQLSPCDQ